MSRLPDLSRRRFLLASAGLLTTACGPDVQPVSEKAPSLPETRSTGAAAADLVIFGGTILTLDPRLPEVEALAARDGKIVHLGSAEEAQQMRAPSTEVVDLRGGLAVPGLTDAHGHVTGLGRNLEEVDLRGSKSIEEVVQRIQGHGTKGKWILGRGWDQNLWPDKAMPTHAALTAAFPDRPVWLRRVDGHAGWGNAALLEAANIGAGTRPPKGGEILLDSSGAPTGVLVDAAMDLVPVPEPTEQDVERWIRAAQKHLLARGITGVHDMGVDAVTDGVYRRMLDKKTLDLRIHGYASETWFEKELLGSRKPDTVAEDSRYALVGVKVYADGALGSRGAYMLHPYSDRKGHRGLMQRSAKSLAALATSAMGEGWQMATHAIGDGGNRAVLDAYEQAHLKHRIDDHRFRVEHAQIVDPTDISRFVSGRVLASMQPTHATSDMAWVPARIGESRLAGAYAWKRFLNAGVHLCFGSDFPVELADITHGLYAAMTRQDPEGKPEGGWLPDQRLTLEQALRGFSAEAAYAVRREKHLGKLEEGMQADVTCFHEDLRELQPAQVREAKIRATIVAGKTAYRS